MPEEAIAGWALQPAHPEGKRVGRLRAAISGVTIFRGQFRNQLAAPARSYLRKLHCSSLHPHATTCRETHHSITDALAAVQDRLLPSFLV